MREELLERLHHKEVEILKEFDRICCKYNLRYYLIAGSLLGAIRHKGFIPWDDDIDVAMPRDDYEKFVVICKKELNSNFFLQTSDTDPNWKRYYGKLRMNGTLFVERKNEHMLHHQGIFIDIFPLDCGKMVVGRIGRLKSRCVILINNHLLMCNNERPFTLPHKMVDLIVPPFVFYLLRRKWLSNRGDSYLNYGGLYGIAKESFLIEQFDPPVFVEFEGEKFKAPNDYHSYLCKLYGESYMELPPEDKRITHDPVKLSFDISGPDEILD